MSIFLVGKEIETGRKEERKKGRKEKRNKERKEQRNKGTKKGCCLTVKHYFCTQNFTVC